MEGSQSTVREDRGLPSANKPSNDKEINTKTSIGGKEGLEEKADGLPDSSMQNENISQLSNIAKHQIESKENTTGKSIRNCFDETSLQNKSSSLTELNNIGFQETSLECKDNSSRIFIPVIKDESASEKKANFVQASAPVFSHDSEDKDSFTGIDNPNISDITCLGSDADSFHEFINTISDEIVSETKRSSLGISNLAIPEEENKTSSTRKSVLQVSEETGLQIKIGSLQVPNPMNFNETATENNSNLLLISNLTIPGKTAPENPSLPLTDTSFNKNVSSNSLSLSFQETELLFKLPEKSTINKRKNKNAVRKQRYQLPPKDNEKIAYDFKPFSQAQTGNTRFEWKLSSSETSGTTVPKKPISGTQDSFAQNSSPKILDVNVLETNQKLPDLSKPVISGETSLEEKFSSFHISKPASLDKTATDKNSCLPRISKRIIPDHRDSSNLVLLKTSACIDSISTKDSSHEGESLVKPKEASITKNTRKRKRNGELRKGKIYQSFLENYENEENPYSVSGSEAFEIHVNCEDKSTQTRKNLVADVIDSESASFPPGTNRFRDLDEDTLRKIRLLLSDCLSWLPNVSETSLSKEATTQNEDLRNPKKSECPTEANLRICHDDISTPSTIKISPTGKSIQKTKPLQSEADSNTDSSKLKENLNRAQEVSVEHNQNSCNLSRNSSLNQSRPTLDRSTKHRSIFFELDGAYFEISDAKTPLRTKTCKNDSSISNAKNKGKINQNQSFADSSKTENSDNRSGYIFDSTIGGNRESNRNRSQSHSRKAGNSFEHGLDILLPKTLLRTKTSGNEPSNSNTENTREISRNQSWTDTFKAKNTDNRNRYHFDSIEGVDSESSRNRSQPHFFSKLDNSDEHGLEIKSGFLQISNIVKSAETPSENTDLPLISNLAIPGENASDISPLPTTGTLIYENSSRNTESLSTDGTELLFTPPEKSARNRRHMKNTVRKQRHQLCVPPKDNQNKAYDFKPFSQTNTESIPLEWKFSSSQISSSTIQGEDTSDRKEILDQTSNSTIPEETTSDIKSSLGHTSISKGFDETTSESNENLTNKSKSEISDPRVENKFSHLSIASPVNPDEPTSDRNSGLPNLFRPTFPDDSDFFNPVRLATAARNLSQSNSSKIDNNKTNNENLSEWWTLFSVEPDESIKIWDIATALFLQLLVFTATEYVYKYFNFIFFLLLVFIAWLCILCSSGFVFYCGSFYSL